MRGRNKGGGKYNVKFMICKLQNPYESLFSIINSKKINFD